jgi:hypothetical protein
MKKRVYLFAVLLLFLTLNFYLVSSADVDKVMKAYTCLQNKIDATKCGSSLGIETQIFSLLALQDKSGTSSTNYYAEQCVNAILSSGKLIGGGGAALSATPNQIETPTAIQCWPKTSGGACDLKTTAQAILALDGAGVDTTTAEEWMISQKMVPRSTDITWMIQIESKEATSCKIKYNNIENLITIETDRKIRGTPGTCLSIMPSQYWLKINEGCYDKTFSITCDKSFLSNLLYTKGAADTVYVSENTHTADPNQNTTELIESLCFKQGTDCNYEGSLWASIVLNKKGYDLGPFIPYLTVNKASNAVYFPDAFLYHLQDGYLTDYRFSIAESQKQNKYWQFSSDKFYDTALALYTTQYDNGFQTQTDKSKAWLLDTSIQDSSGCWQKGSVNYRDTAFLLYSAWSGSEWRPPMPDCRKDADCLTGQACNLTSQKCMDKPECRSDAQCLALNVSTKKFCSTDLKCVECKSKANCQPLEECNVGSCTPTGWDCENNLQCSIKNTTKNFCLNTTHTCEECVYDAQCSYKPGYRCDTSSNVCYQTAECGLPGLSNCSSGKTCVDGWCEATESECPCQYGFECLNDKCYVIEGGDSTGCTSNNDCADGEECDQVTGECVDVSPDCESTDYFCRSELSCTYDDGNIFNNYFCSGSFVCCDVGIKEQTCSDASGIVCKSNENCVGGIDTPTSDLTSGEICCVGGTCEAGGTGDLSACQNNGGSCRSSCFSGESTMNENCADAT